MAWCNQCHSSQHDVEACDVGCAVPPVCPRCDPEAGTSVTYYVHTRADGVRVWHYDDGCGAHRSGDPAFGIGGLPVPMPVVGTHRAELAANLGRKDDQGKPRYDLIPPLFEQDLARVLTYGAAKYGDDNWRIVPDAVRRYRAALRRHLLAFQLGEDNDQESGLPHLAHAACCVVFLLELSRGSK